MTEIHGASVLQGPNYCVTTACATGTHSIGAALKHLRDGEADVMIAGGSEAALTPLCYAGFCALTAMVTKYNDTPEKASKPFDKDRCFGLFLHLCCHAWHCNCTMYVITHLPLILTHIQTYIRAGFVMSEGCGVIVMETEEHALARGAKIYCELAVTDYHLTIACLP